MRRSDIKQIRRRLTCAALRVWDAYRTVEHRINVVFLIVQNIEAILPQLDPDHEDTKVIAAKLGDVRAEAHTLTELLAWYKAGHEQLNAMIAVAEARAKELK